MLTHEGSEGVLIQMRTGPFAWQTVVVSADNRLYRQTKAGEEIFICLIPLEFQTRRQIRDWIRRNMDLVPLSEQEVPFAHLRK